MTNTAADKLAVVTVTYNSAKVLPGLLDSLEAGLEGIKECDIIVADNASRDDSVQIALRHPIGVRVVQTGSNAGYAAAINAAARTIDDSTHLLILNPDLRLTKSAVLPLLARTQDPTIGITVPHNLKEDGTTDPTIRREPSIMTAWAGSLLGGRIAARLGIGELIDGPDSYKREQAIEWATGSAMLVTPAARRAVGEWDESFFLYSEEVEYQRRVREAGFKIVYVPASTVVHAGGDYRTNPRLFALLTSNRIRYFGRHHGPFQTLVFRLGVAVGELLRAWNGETHRQALKCALMPLRPVSDFRS